MTHEMTVRLPANGSGKESPDNSKCPDRFSRTLMLFSLLLAALFGTYELCGKQSSLKNTSSERNVTLAVWRNNASLSVNDSLAEEASTSLRFNFSQFVRELLKQQNAGSGKTGVQSSRDSLDPCILRRGIPQKFFVYGTCSYEDYFPAFQVSATLKTITPVRAGPSA